MARRDKRVRDFMTKMEQTVIAGENKKQQLEEDNQRKYEEKRNFEEMLEDERRKKKLQDQREDLKTNLHWQLNEKDLKRKVDQQNKTEFVQYWNDKIASDLERERQEKEALKQKNLEVLRVQQEQIEEKKKQRAGMSQAEFEMNKNFLKEIAQ